MHSVNRCLVLTCAVRGALYASSTPLATCTRVRLLFTTRSKLEMFWPKVVSPMSGVNPICLQNYANLKALAHVHRAAHSMPAKAVAWQQSSSQDFPSMAQTLNVSLDMAKYCCLQCLYRLFQDLRWTIQSLPVLR